MPLPLHAVYQPQRTCKAHLIPVEILSEIFLYCTVEFKWDQKPLMLVCRRWHAIMLSTPGFLSDLWIGRSTTIEVVKAVIQRRRWLLNVIVDPDYVDPDSDDSDSDDSDSDDPDHDDPNDEEIQGDWDADEFYACFATAIEAASKWRELEFRSFPPPGEYRGLHIIPPLEKLESFTLPQGCDLGDFFEPLINAIATTPASRLAHIKLGNVDAVLYLMRSASLHGFCSLRTLDISLSKRMESPVNFLPYLQGLKRFTARHLHLPIYPPDTYLPLVQTLDYLELKSVSVQWMAGKVFPALGFCSITYPHYASALTLQPVTVRSCTFLEFDSNDLHPLRYFVHAPLTRLRVTCGQWTIGRGNHQLVALCPIFVASAESLTMLDLEVKVSEQLLAHILSLFPALEELDLTLASPQALSQAFFRAFVVTNSNAESPSEMVGSPSQTITPKLRELNLHYKRWLRAPERKALIPVFGDIVASHWTNRDFKLWLDIGRNNPKWWRVKEVIESMVYQLHPAMGDTSSVGILAPHGIVHLESDLHDHDSFLDIPFKEAEYLAARGQLSIECLSSLHCLVELRVGDHEDILPTAPPHNLPLFHTLRVLEVYNIHQLFFIGQTFHRLERCKILSSQESHSLIFGLPTEMPVCTRLDAKDLTLLATLKLPQICELGVSFDHPESNLIWGKHIAANANLSGLKVLHVHHWGVGTDLIQILRFLPVLEDLIVGNGQDLDVTFFKSLILAGKSRATGQKEQSGGEGYISPLPFPMLKSLSIEGVDPRKRPGLLTLKDVVTLRAMGGSPLNMVTFLQFTPQHRREFKLMKGDGSFGMEIVALPVDAKPFQLFI